MKVLTDSHNCLEYSVIKYLKFRHDKNLEKNLFCFVNILLSTYFSSIPRIFYSYNSFLQENIYFEQCIYDYAR